MYIHMLTRPTLNFPTIDSFTGSRFVLVVTLINSLLQFFEEKKTAVGDLRLMLIWIMFFCEKEMNECGYFQDRDSA